MSVKRRLIPINELTLVTPVEAFHDPREPPLSIGNRVHFNSDDDDASAMLVVDFDGQASRSPTMTRLAGRTNTPCRPSAFTESGND